MFSKGTTTLGGRSKGAGTQSRMRMKGERSATLLLPNAVAADDTERHATDRPVKICRQINIRWGAASRAAMAITAFRVRCMSEKLLDTTGNGYSTSPIDYA